MGQTFQAGEGGAVLYDLFGGNEAERREGAKPRWNKEDYYCIIYIKIYLYDHKRSSGQFPEQAANRQTAGSPQGGPHRSH